MAFESSVSQAVVGSDTVIRLQWRDTQGGGIPTFAARNFGIEDATLCEFTSDWEVNDVASRSRAEWGIFRSEEGEGIVVSIERNGATWTLQIGTTLSWAQYGSFVDSTTTLPGLAVNTFFRMHIKAEVKDDDSTTVTATIRTTGDVDIGTVTATVKVPRGNFCGFHSTFDQLGGASRADFKNIRVQASGSTGLTPNLTAVNYVYTFVNDLGEEGAPSFPTEDVLRPDGVTVTLTTLTSAPVVDSVTYDRVTKKRIYRLVSGTTGDVYRLVTEIPLATATFTDDLTDNELPTTILESDEYDLPHPDMEGIISLPNGLCAGFFENQLCLSATGWCHAWPVRQRLRVDSDIVAICNIDNTIVIGTKTFVYTATGNDGASYSMSKPGAAQSCTSKLGMVYLDGKGVVFPSPDGWCVCAGSAGNVPVVSEGIFTKEQWQQYDPTSIIAAVHDNVLHWYWKTEEAVTETVLFLFHMTDAASAEGISEFTALYDAADQTGANWTPNQPNWFLADSIKKFGMSSLTTSGNVVFSRDVSQPTAPATFSTVGVSTLQIDTWVYIDSDRPTEARAGIDVGVFTYPIETFLFFQVKPFGSVRFGFESADEESTNEVDDITIALDTWTHVRLLCVGNTIRLYVNGVASVRTVETATLDPIGDSGPINLMRINLVASLMLLDEARGLLGGSADTSNFTPQVTPWPNP